MKTSQQLEQGIASGVKPGGDVQKRKRFGALIRVSTERQEQSGGSLAMQRRQICEAVDALGGHIVGWYGGQEHATPGWEKAEVDRLLTDARRQDRPFDCVIVSHSDRWSRDNAKSTEGIEIFRENRIDFFIGRQRQELFDPHGTFRLRIDASVGRFYAESQNKRSIEIRIDRARQGRPTCGKLPFGRTYDPKTGAWGLDAEKLKLIESIAERYLAGERLPDLAREHGLNHSNLHKVLTKRCGTEWIQSFSAPEFNINETVTTPIPPLLPAETIEAIKTRVEANKTWHHGPHKNGTPYLLGRVIFCEHCGYALFGQLNRGKRRYYRHNHAERKRGCEGPKSWIPAEAIEEPVIELLFETFGNPTALKRAIEAATPDLEKTRELNARVRVVEKGIESVSASRARILRILSRGDSVLSEADVAHELTELKSTELRHREELDRLNALLGNRPSQASIAAVSKRIAADTREGRYPSFQHVKMVSGVRRATAVLEAMTWPEKRQLIESLFCGRTVDGRRLGIYIRWDTGANAARRWTYKVHGHLPVAQSKWDCASAAVKSAWH